VVFRFHRRGRRAHRLRSVARTTTAQAAFRARTCGSAYAGGYGPRRPPARIRRRCHRAARATPKCTAARTRRPATARPSARVSPRAASPGCVAPPGSRGSISRAASAPSAKARPTKFRSSRTFPRHARPISSCMSVGAMARRCPLGRNRSTSSGMSSRLARSGGTVIGKTFNRKNKSSRKLPSLTISPRFRCVAAREANVRRSVRGVPHTSVRLALDEPQELRLHGQGELSNFIKEHRPPIGGFHAPLARVHRSGERTSGVPEQLRVHQVLGHGAAVHDDEWLPGAGRRLMNGASHDLLTGARLSFDEDGLGERRDTRQRLKQFAHDHGAPHEAPEGRFAPQLHGRGRVRIPYRYRHAAQGDHPRRPARARGRRVSPKQRFRSCSRGHGPRGRRRAAQAPRGVEKPSGPQCGRRRARRSPAFFAPRPRASGDRFGPPNGAWAGFASRVASARGGPLAVRSRDRIRRRSWQSADYRAKP
jgi:hypothetical protein